MGSSGPSGVAGTPYEFELLDQGDALSAEAQKALDAKDLDALIDIIAAKKTIDDAYEESRVATTWRWANERRWEQ